jgi:hypothetical protein
MKPQFDNQVISSFYLWFDNKVTIKGEAFENYGSQFYPSDNLYQGYYTYAAPYKQLVADHSIADATIMSGVHIQSGGGFTFITSGTNDFSGINYNEGQLYFSSEQTGIVSGDYSIKEFSIHLTDQDEGFLLFETRYHRRPKTFESPTGLPANSLTYPAVFIKQEKSENVPFSFGGQDETIVSIRAICLADSQFNSDAISSIFRDSKYDLIPLMPESEMPFNVFGDYRDGQKYNYIDFATGTAHQGNQLYINDVKVSRVSYNKMEQRGDFRDINPEVYTTIIDFEVRIPRFPRSDC